MRRLVITLLVLVFILSCAHQQPAVPQAAQKPTAPPTRQEGVAETLHGMEMVDPYQWLEDQESPETRAWIEAQNAYTDVILGHLPSRESLQRRVTELQRVEVIGFPTARSGRYFFSKRKADQELFVIHMREGLDGADQVLIDPHPMSNDHTTSVGTMDVSEDGNMLVYNVREGGVDEVSIRLFDVDRRENMTDTLPKARYSGASISPDKRDLYYTRHTAEGPRVFHHVIGSDPASDQKLFGDGYGREKIIGANLSEDGRYLLITVSHGSAAPKTELYLKDVGKDGPIVPVVNDLQARNSADVLGDNLVIQTNWNAPNGRVFMTTTANPTRESWKEIIPERKDATMQSVNGVGGRIWVQYLQDVKPRVVSHDLSGRPLSEISFPTLGSVSNLGGRWDSAEGFYSFASYHQPTTIYRYDIATGAQGIWSRPNIPVDSDQFEVKQVWYRSKDGTRVPMFLMHRKGLRMDGNAPVYMTGYGGFTLSQTPGFSSTAVIWAESGGIYAVPNLRGGGEFGEEWHRAGMLERKQNVFDDFIGAAEWLIANGYTNSRRLAVAGGSNGGLLVGALITQRPDLVRAAIISYPLLDMVRYHKFLVAGFWVPEYGSAEDAEQFRYIRSYSPYHNVRKGTKYPAVLFITGDADTRVAPLHARKMAALVQAANASENPIVLRYHISAGHSGGQPLSEQIKNAVESLSFLFWQLGV